MKCEGLTPNSLKRARRNLAPHCGHSPDRQVSSSPSGHDPRDHRLVKPTGADEETFGRTRGRVRRPAHNAQSRRLRINPRQVVKERITPIRPSRYCRAVVLTRPISVRADDEIRDRWQHGFSAASLGNGESQVIQSRTSVVMGRGDHRTAIYRTFTCEGQSQFDENTEPFPPRIGFDDGGGVT